MSYVIGLDVGGTTIKGGAFSNTFECKAEIRLPTYQKRNHRDEILSTIAMAVQRLKDETASLNLGELAGVGIGVPGFVKSSEGVVYEAANLELTNVNLKNWVEENVGIPCAVQGDARTGALAEHELGAAKGQQSSLYVVIGTGVGSGIILNGHIYEGIHAAAGEIGHAIVNPDGELCSCGKRGCLETIVSAPHISRAYQERTGVTEAISAKMVAERAQMGDSDGQAVFRQVAQSLAQALANCCTIVDPSIVVIGGGVSQAGDVLFQPLREFFSVYASSIARRQIRIVPAELGDRSGIVGASLLASQFV